MLSVVLAAATEGAEKAHDLPLSPLGFGLVAAAVFAALFGMTWSFRGFANKQPH